MIFKKINQFQVSYDGNNYSEKILRDCLTFDFPNAEFTSAFQGGYWDGKIRFYDKKTKLIKIGLVSFVIDALEEQDVKYKKIDFDKQFHKINTSNLTESLYQHQVEGVVQFFKDESGIVKFPTRTGKTYFASECLRLVNQQYKDSITLFIVDGEDLFHQAIKDISDFLKIPKAEIGQIKGEKVIFKQNTVATIQTLQSIFSKRTSKTKLSRKKEIQKHLSRINFVVIDEIHDSLNSEERYNLFKHFRNIYWLLGLSATPYSKDEDESGGLDLINNIKRKAFFGGISFEVDSDLMKERGILAKEKTLLLIYEHKVNQRKKAELESEVKLSKNKYFFYSDKLMFSNNKRDQVVLITLALLRNLKFKTLGLFSSKKHGYKIATLSGDKFISGDSHSTERLEAKKKFLNGVGKILLASDIYKKGVTLPEVEVVFNIDGGYEDNLIIQRKGRVLGVTNDKKNALIIDLIDISENYLSEHGLNRIKVYEKFSGMENIDVIYLNIDENGDVDLGQYFDDLRQYLEDYDRG